MDRKRTFKFVAIAFSIVALTSFGVLGGIALAQEAGAVEVEAEFVEVNALEAAVELLSLVRSELADDVLAGASPAEWPVIAAFVVNLLEGPASEHFRAEYALPQSTHDRGVISYVEELAGTTATALAEEDVVALLESDETSPATAALLRLLVANELLLSEDVDLDVLATAADQVNAAFALLQAAVVD